MLTRSSWLHLRIPFSYFLMPVYLFTLSISPNLNDIRTFWVFVILHFFLYPASNGFNSYFDKDEKSIGGLKNPPAVTADLYYLALVFDGVALVLSLWKVNVVFTLMVLVYGLVSKAYSHPTIRLKKFPIFGWLVTGIFQGAFTFIMCFVGINNLSLENVYGLHILFPALLTTIMLWGNYPMTQVYQHDEDQKRGDHTISLKLGIRGTFLFTSILFTIATGGYIFYFITFFKVQYALQFLLALTPVLAYFLYWFLAVQKNETKADYTHTMILNFISATCLNIFFIWFFLNSTQVLQAVMNGH